MSELDPASTPELSGIMYIPNPNSRDKQRYAELYEKAWSMSKRTNRFITGSFIALFSTTAHNVISNDSSVGSLPQAISMVALTASLIYETRVSGLVDDFRNERESLGFSPKQQQEILEHNGIK